MSYVLQPKATAYIYTSMDTYMQYKTTCPSQNQSQNMYMLVLMHLETKSENIYGGFIILCK